MSSPAGNGKIYRIIATHPNLTEAEIRDRFYAEWDGPKDQRGKVFHQALKHLLNREAIDKISHPGRGKTNSPNTFVLSERSELRLADNTSRDERPVRNTIQ